MHPKQCWGVVLEGWFAGVNDKCIVCNIKRENPMKNVFVLFSWHVEAVTIIETYRMFLK
jgi:hypothetical protein